MKKRKYALYAMAVIFGLLVSCKRKAEKLDDKKKLNVLFLFADDLNDIVMAGHPQVKCPNIHRLMKMGMTFTNAYSNAPLCAPSRASLLSGLMPTTSGYFGGIQYDWRKNPVLKDSKTFMGYFRDKGYDVYGTGKIFHHRHPDTTVWINKDGKYLHGYDASFGPFPWDGKGLPNNKKGWGVRHPDFPTVDTDALPTSLANVPHYDPNPSKGIPGYNGWRLYYKPFKYNSEDDRDLMPDELSANWATEQLKKKHDRPFMLCVGFNRPHAPLIAPQKYFDMFPLKDIQLAPAVANDTADCAKILVRKTDYGTGDHGYENYRQVQTLGPDGLKKWTQAYLACIAYMDDQLGKVLDALENSAYADNTVIFLSSDHGYHMGEKKWLFKNTLWRKGAHIPFVFAGPDIKPGSSSSMPVSLIDFYPTIVDLCGLPDKPNDETNQLPLDGKSLKPILYGETNVPINPYALSFVSSKKNAEPEGVMGKYTDHHTAISTENYRYIRCYNGEEELYNIKKDPQELENLASKKSSQEEIAKMRKIYDNIGRKRTQLDKN